MFKIINNRRGFTLMEMIIAAGLFAILSVVVSGIFMAANNLQQQAVSSERLQNDGRYILDKIAKEVRGREVNLVYPSDNPTSTLSFKSDEFNDVVTFFYDSNSVWYDINGDFATLNSDDVEVIDLKFFTYPTKDPFSYVSPADIQPRVTVFLKMRNKLQNKYQKEIFLQTTISSKYYRR
ncbi:MAG: prepilin-type N-terminal cleavage/methylation domain-containing protein [Patescibacteria group bacterium]